MVEKSTQVPRAVSFQQAEPIARLYRRLVVLVGLYLILACFGRVSPGAIRDSTAALVVGLVVLVCGLWLLLELLWTARKLMSHLGARYPVLWALGMALPCVNILVLLGISSRANAWCARHNIEVGFLGPTKASLERLRTGQGP